MEHWGLLEADFLDTYGVMEPLDLKWRKFLLLVRGLTPESRFLNAVWDESPAKLRRMLRSQQGHPDVPRNRVSLEDFQSGIGMD